jgi:ABC-type transport system involved in multi-copper enzyme maturation permease subunit
MGVLAAIGSAVRLEWIGRLTGPIFGKELRVSARRGRSYLLRCGYLALLTIYVAAVWSSDVERPLSMLSQPTNPYGSARGRITSVLLYNPVDLLTQQQTMIAARMADAGRAIVRDIVWFELLVLPLLAAILLSAAVSEELRRRTLDVLMSTPTTAAEIIRGKIASQMFQIVLLAAISLPLLVLVRVFGGVPWQYIAMSMTTVLLACLVAATVAAAGAARQWMPLQAIAIACGMCFPFAGIMMYFTDLYLEGPSQFGAGALSVWIFLACWMAALTILYLRAAGRQLALTGSRRTGDWVMEFLRRPQVKRAPSQPGMVRSDGHRRPIGQWPVLWRESHARLIVNQAVGLNIGAIAFGILLLFDGVVARSAYGTDLVKMKDWGFLSALLTAIGILATVIAASGGIAYEKEAGTLTALLSTPLGRWEIVLGKAAGAARRAAPTWGLLVLHVGIGMIASRPVHPEVAAATLLGGLGAAVFCIGLGLCVSAYASRATSATAVAVSIVVGVFFIFPMILTMAARALGAGDVLPFMGHIFNPVAPIVERCTGVGGRVLAPPGVMQGDEVAVLAPLLICGVLGAGLIAITVRHLQRLGAGRKVSSFRFQVSSSKT